MNCNVEILKESGYSQAMLGLSLSYNKPIQDMEKVSKILYKKDKGHNKFLESICVWLDIKMPRYWWQEFDTYRVGTTKQSESTIHTITKNNISMDDFIDGEVDTDVLYKINKYIRMYNLNKKLGDTDVMNSYFLSIKRYLPEGYLQRRVVCTNYKVLRNMVNQRKNHKLGEWVIFINHLKENCKYQEFLK